jgi:hypothetical protein
MLGQPAARATWDQNAAENGGVPELGNGFPSPRAKHLQKKKGSNTLRLLLVGIAAALVRRTMQQCAQSCRCSAALQQQHWSAAPCVGGRSSG